VPVYADAVADELAYVLAHAEVRFAAVEDQEQVDKILSVSERLPKLETMVYDERAGFATTTTPAALDRRRHRRWPQALRRTPARAWLDAEIAAGKGSDTSIILYTSGTTGQSKGVVLSAERCIARAPTRCLRQADREGRGAGLSAARLGRRPLSQLRARLVAGFCMACPESGDTAMADLREIGRRSSSRRRAPSSRC
jgi:long-chain acyl-CoA synthetase